MTAKLLEEKWHIDIDYGYRCRFIDSKTEREVLHFHEFYEIFLNQTDGLEHHINGKIIELKEGELVFTRPHDEHYFTHSDPHSFINLAFSEKVAKSLFSYLSSEFSFTELLEAKLPPSVILTDSERENVENMFQTLNMIAPSEITKKRIQCKLILAEIFGNYFINYTPDACDKRPKWFADVCHQMTKKENFTAGADAMVRISNKSYAHLCRCIKKYYNQTMSDYINDIRINYATNLLLQTNMSIIDIAFESGFSSQNWFNLCFKKKYNISPNAMRKNPNAQLIMNNK